MKEITAEEAVRLCKAGEKLTSEEKDLLVKQRLKELVSYVKEHSPYFSRAYADIDDNFSLHDLPPTSKAELMKSYEDWVTDPEITYNKVMEYLDKSSTSLDLFLDKYTVLTTSGTSGTPMPMVRDRYHNMIHGMMIKTRLLHNPDIMDPKKYKPACIIFTDPRISSYSSFMKVKLANPGYEQNLLALSVKDGIDKIVKELNDFQPDLVSAYPSAMGPVIKAKEDGLLKINPEAFGFSAEPLTVENYLKVKNTFGCHVFNNYCSTEGGEAAMSCECGNLHINDDWVIIEPVDKEGNPVPEGEWSDGIYITDLTNYVQPIIRYFMNDKIKITRGCSCGSNRPVMNILGRVLGEIEIDGMKISAVVVEYELHAASGVYSYQLAQTAERRFELRAEFAEDADKAAIFGKFKQTFSEYLRKYGCGEVEIILSDEAPRRSEKGGKIKFFVKEF